MLTCSQWECSCSAGVMLNTVNILSFCVCVSAEAGWSRRASSTSLCITSSACTRSSCLTPPRSRVDAAANTQTETHHCTPYRLRWYASLYLASSQSHPLTSSNHVNLSSPQDRLAQTGLTWNLCLPDVFEQQDKNTLHPPPKKNHPSWIRYSRCHRSPRVLESRNSQAPK